MTPQFEFIRPWILMATLPLCAVAAITDVKTQGTTNTQAVIAYTAPDGNACRMGDQRVPVLQPPCE